MRNRLAVALGALAVGSLAATPALSADKVAFQANWLIQGENAYMFAGREKGFYTEEGIELSISRGFGSGDTVKKIALGTATVGTADIGAIILARLRENVPVKCITAEYTQSPHSFWVLETSGIRSIKDLAGKRIGTTPGNSHQVYFPLLARANGIDPASVRFVNMEASALLPTLVAERIDAMPGFATVYEIRNKEVAGQGKSMLALPFAGNGLRLYGECQLVAEKTIAEQPDLLKRYVRATQKSLRWAHQNPEEAARIHVRHNPEIPEANILVNHKTFMTGYVFDETAGRLGLGGFDKEQLQRTFNAVVESQQLTTSVDVASIIDTRFLPAKP